MYLFEVPSQRQWKFWGGGLQRVANLLSLYLHGLRMLPFLLRNRIWTVDNG